MTFVSFEDYQPLPRFPPVVTPWTLVHIQESAAQDGPWTTIDTFALSPLDSDPADPAIRSFSTDNATLSEGWYRVVFEDAIGNTSPTTPEHNKPSDAASYLPLVSDIGALLRARTKNVLGVEVGTFTEDTRPTFEEVQRLIEQAAGDVTALVDYDIPLETYRQASGVIALGAAMLVELSYFPEQVAANKSAYEKYKELYDEYLERLLAAVEREAAEEVGGETPMIGGGYPAYAFPTAEGLWGKVF